MRLFVDDLRPAPGDWVLAKTITRAITILSTMKVSEVSLDHDIIFNTEQEDFTAVAWFIVNMPREYRPKTVYVHTANPNGADRLFAILKEEVDEVLRDSSYKHEWIGPK